MNRIILVAAGIGALFVIAAYLLFAWLHGPWIVIDRQPGVTYFYDSRSAQGEDGKVRVRVLLDYKAPQATDKGAYRSVTDSLVINCSERRFFSDKRMAFADRMASGAPLFREDSPLPYKPVPKFLEPVLDRYCKG
jgi:hypothetical protein